jgi:CubicO group peptidase (beta-lactamase class C family)
MRVRRAAALLALLALAAPLPADPPAGAPAAPAARSPARRDVSAAVARIRERHEVPALIGGLVVGADLVAWGVDGVRARGKPERATLGDRWHLGSCTKAMTATLCALLVVEKTLAFDLTLGAALPADLRAEWKAHEGWSSVSLQHLLTNRGAFPGDLAPDGLWGRPWARRGTPEQQRLDLVRGVLARAPAREPGRAYEYSNAGFAAAGVLAERAAGEPYEALIARRLFAPLGMTSGGFGVPGSAERVDQPWGHRDDGKAIAPGPMVDNPPAIAPAGTVHCTLEDWAKFVSLHLEARAGRSRLLTRAAAEHLHTPPRGADPAYACGWIVAERPWGGTVLTHAGSNTMWYCVAWLAPERGFAVLALTNQAGDRASAACDDLAAALIREHAQAPRGR